MKATAMVILASALTAAADPWVALDESGSVPLIAWADSLGNEIRVVTRTASGWVHEIPDTDGVRYYNGDITRDALGQPVLACAKRYQEGLFTLYDMLVRTKTPGGWQTNLLDHGVNSPGNIDLCPAPNGTVGLAYRHWGQSFDLVYASNAAGSWAAEVIFSGDTCRPSDFSLAFDADSKPLMAYYDGYYGDFYLLQRDAGKWHQQPMAIHSGCVSSACAVDSGGTPYVFYTFSTSGQLRLDTTWQDEWVSLMVAKTDYSIRSITADVMTPGSIPVLAFQSGEGTNPGVIELNYAFFQDPLWQVETIDSWSGYMYGLAFDLAPDHVPHIAYVKNDVLYYGSRIGGSWEIEEVTSVLIPEPMTLALLAMGGLALLRRRR